MLSTKAYTKIAIAIAIGLISLPSFADMEAAPEPAALSENSTPLSSIGISIPAGLGTIVETRTRLRGGNLLQERNVGLRGLFTNKTPVNGYLMNNREKDSRTPLSAGDTESSPLNTFPGISPVSLEPWLSHLKSGLEYSNADIHSEVTDVTRKAWSGRIFDESRYFPETSFKDSEIHLGSEVSPRMHGQSLRRSLKGYLRRDNRPNLRTLPTEPRKENTSKPRGVVSFATTLLAAVAVLLFSSFGHAANLPQAGLAAAALQIGPPLGIATGITIFALLYHHAQKAKRALGENVPIIDFIVFALVASVLGAGVSSLIPSLMLPSREIAGLGFAILAGLIEILALRTAIQYQKFWDWFDRLPPLLTVGGIALAYYALGGYLIDRFSGSGVRSGSTEEHYFGFFIFWMLPWLVWNSQYILGQLKPKIKREILAAFEKLETPHKDLLTGDMKNLLGGLGPRTKALANIEQYAAQIGEPLISVLGPLIGDVNVEEEGRIGEILGKTASKKAIPLMNRIMKDMDGIKKPYKYKELRDRVMQAQQHLLSLPD